MSYLLPEQSQAPFPSSILPSEPQEVWWNQMTTGLFTVGKSLIVWVTSSNLLLNQQKSLGMLQTWQKITQRSCRQTSAFPGGTLPATLSDRTRAKPWELQGNAAAAVDSHKQAVSVSLNPLNLIITGFWTPAYPGSCREPQSINWPVHTQTLFWKDLFVLNYQGWTICKPYATTKT